jgi:hypothetical protein
MAKAKKPKPKPRADKYEEKLKINGNFEELVKALVIPISDKTVDVKQQQRKLGKK